MPTTHDGVQILRGIAAQEAARLRDGTLPWSWWLEHAARFGRYGFVNTLLIAAQWRAAADVRSYEEWRTAGRQVRKGETGIRIISRSGGPRAVFDLSQTEGLPLHPAAPTAPGPVRDRLAVLASRRFPHAEFPTHDLAAFLHQLAHALRGVPLDPPGSPACRGLRRIEADSVTFLVLTRLGLEPPPADFPEAAPWAEAAFGDRVLRLARLLHAHATDPSGDLMSAAHRFFRGCLPSSWVPAYLTGRGFARAVQRRWQIGYAPAGPYALTDHLRSLGHPEDSLVVAGLARRRRSGRLYDTFRDRMMFAIRTSDGTIAGFIGRVPDDAGGPKYLNTPDTALFHKSELLYGLYETRHRLAEGARPVLVEGPLDAIAVNLASAREHAAVATCGLALTPAHVTALSRIAPLARSGVVVALDGDAAGRSAARRTWQVLRHLDGPLDAAVLPADHDPADILHASGRTAVRQALRAPVPLMDVVVDHAVQRSGGDLATPEQRLAALRAAITLIAAGHPEQAPRQVVRLAGRTDLPAELVTEALVDAVSPDP